MADTLLTQEGLDKLQAELDQLINVWRPDIARRIKDARELGDLKENAEYHAAKDEQGLYEAKIRQIEEQIRNAKIVEADHSGKGGVGAAVTVVDSDGERDTYVLTGAAEADPINNRISLDSPIGRALTGSKPGDTVQVELPSSTLTLTVEHIKPG